MTTKIDAEQAAEQLPELLERTQSGERFLIQRNGEPVAAVVSFADLSQLDNTVLRDYLQTLDDEREREEVFLRVMEQRGLISRPDPGKIIPFSERPLIHIKGKPLSETIIEDRR
jgi:prevent-host-death family protein